jgi:hypothetical protein
MSNKREAFEEDFSRRNLPIDYDEARGRYLYDNTLFAWYGWQACSSHYQPLLAEKDAESVAQALDLIQQDPHQWSMRPCPTCKSITAITGKVFGCYRYQEQRTTQQPKDTE